MGKIIKKRVEKSLPILIILTLVSFFVSGVYFNIDFDLVKFNQNKSFIGMGPEVQADTASTTVTVQNSAPTVTAAAESPASTSTFPINVGESATFIATGTDDGGDAYYLIVCDTDSVATVTAGNPPTCQSGYTFCVSAATSSSGSGITCTDSSVPDPGAETDEWYLFLCDDHDTEPQCSASSQGAGGNEDSDSPIHINHAPIFDEVNTTVDDRVPGGTFTITASTTDSDVLGLIDRIEFFVCSTDSWTVGSGCGGTELCYSSSTSPNVSCNYTDPGPPTADQDYTYYAFVKDWHDFPANSSSSVTSTYTIINVSPVISNVTLNSGSDIALTMKWDPEVAVYTTSTSISDDNGCTDILDATSTMYLGTVTNGPACTASDSDCYQLGAVNCAIKDCSGTIGTAVCSTTFAFYTTPTDGDHTAASTTGWMSRLTIWDEALSTSSSFIATSVDVTSVAAFTMDENSIPYGTVAAGSNTGAVNATTTAANYGNTPIDTGVTGQDMDDGGSNIIEIQNQKHSLSAFDYDLAGIQTSSTTTSTLDVIVPRPTVQATTSDEIYWGIGIPGATPSGDYSGYNTFTVILDDDGNWNYPY